MAGCALPEAASSARGGIYKYSPLCETNEIRCLILECGIGDDPLVCRLEHLVLDGGLHFEAISYVWGNPVRDHSIICNGSRLDITTNLHQSLRQARLRSKPRVLWADSICINQGDNAEKGHQVGMMGQIYSQAQRVLITLGDDDLSNRHCEPVAAIIRQTNEMVLRTLATLDGDWDTFPYPADNDPLLSDPRWQSVEYLTAQPWFQRGWVVQEAGLATEASLLWGHEELNWVEFMRAYMWISHRATSITTEFDIELCHLHIALFDVRFGHESKTMYNEGHFLEDALDILNAARDLQLGDNKDRVYAFLTLPQAGNLLQHLDIDYEKTVQDVYRDVAVCYTEKLGSLDFLHYVEHTDDTWAAESPSWIPHWHIRSPDTTPARDTDCCVTSPLHQGVMVLVIQGKILQTRGYIFDKIGYVSQDFRKNPSLEDLASIWESFSRYRHAWAYSTFSPVLAFYQALTTCTRPWVPDAKKRAMDDAYTYHLSGQMALPSDSGLDVRQTNIHDADVQEMHNFILRKLKYRRLVLTERGYFGLVPDHAVKGDLCGVIFGTKTPFLLRSTQRSGHYKLVGESFMISARNFEDGEYPVYMGAGERAHEDWLDWGLEEEDIFLC